MMSLKMSSIDQTRLAGVYNLDNVEPPASMQSVSTSSEDVLEDSLLVVKIISRQYVIMKPEELKALGNDHKVICYADRKSGSLNKLNGERIKALPQDNIEEFLAGMVTALNLVEQGDVEGEELSTLKNGKAKAAEHPEISESRDNLTNEQVQSAIKQALKLVTSAVDKNIDRWVIEAGDRLMSSSSQGGFGDPQRMRAVSSELQSSSSELSKCFQARLIECLHKFNHPEKEQIDLSSDDLSLAEDGHWHKHTVILGLSATITGQTKLDFNQLNRRFSYLLNKRIKPEKNIISPEMIAWCICTAVDDVSYSKEQVGALQRVISELFAGTMGKVYRDINLLWIGMDIIPQIKLRVWQDDYQPGNQ